MLHKKESVKWVTARRRDGAASWTLSLFAGGVGPEVFPHQNGAEEVRQ